MAGRPRTWLGWPVWLVTVLIVVSAVTGSAGPVQVAWALGTISVAVSIAWITLSGWWRSRRHVDDRLPEGHPAEHPDAGPHPPAGTTCGGGTGPAAP